MLKLATILDNPGEPIAETRYRDPAQLRKLGYNGVVFYETTGLSGITAVDDIADDEMRNWVAGQFDKVAGDIERAVQEELDVYLTYDLMSLERGLVERQTDRFSCADQTLMLCPASDGVLEASMAALGALLDRFKQVRGVVLRFGDNDAARLPHLIGNDIYAPHCARCSGLGRGDRICRIIEAFYHLVVKQRHLQLIARAWNVRPNGLHDDSELCRRVQQQLPDDDRLIPFVQVHANGLLALPALESIEPGVR